MTKKLVKLLINWEQHSHEFFNRTSQHLYEENQGQTIKMSFKIL